MSNHGDSIATSINEPETQNYIKYLLDGSGAEQHFAQIRTELELENTSVSGVSGVSNIIESDSSVNMDNKSWASHTVDTARDTRTHDKPLAVLSKSSSLAALEPKLREIGFAAVPDSLRAALLRDNAHELSSFISSLVEKASNLRGGQGRVSQSVNHIEGAQVAALKTERDELLNVVDQLKTRHAQDQVLIEHLSKRKSVSQPLANITDTASQMDDSLLDSVRLPQKADTNVDNHKSQVEKLLEENELLKLRLLASHDSADRLRQSTRELIHQDKISYQVAGIMSGHPEKLAHILSSVCTALGVKSAQELPQSIDRICMAVKLIPQMKHVRSLTQFIYEMIAVVQAFTVTRSSSPNSTSKSEQAVSLGHIVRQTREWAEMCSQVEDLEMFSAQVHEILHIKRSASSLNACLDEMKKFTAKSPRQLYADVPLE